MQPDEHIGESAELYAIGALDSAERAAVDDHIAHCPHCLRRVGEAEETVLALERANAIDRPRAGARAPIPFARRSVTWLLPLAAAAAFVLGLLFPRPAPQHDVATLAMIGSHFSHAQFTGHGPPAKVIYARDRSWYYVIVASRARYAVVGIHHGSSTSLGTTQPSGATSALFTRSHVAFERLELRQNGTVMGSASIR